jgi:threonine/homoserine/homoserine lactone efflux protein
MAYILLPLVALAILFVIHVLNPGFVASQLAHVPERCHGYIRLCGVVGLIWVALTVFCDPRLDLVQSPLKSSPRLLTLKNTTGGIFIGLYIGLFTHRVKRG